MKKYLIISLTVNLLLAIGILGYVLKRGGVEYLKRKLSNQSPLEFEITNDPNWKAKSSLFKIFPCDSSAIYFVGNSLTDRCEWQELLNNKNIKNRGIDRDNTKGVITRISDLTKWTPKAIFLEIGINDLELKIPIKIISENINTIINLIQKESPLTDIFVQSLLPINVNKISSDSIIFLNNRIEKLCSLNKVTFINLYDIYSKNSHLEELYTSDGVHLTADGYTIWALHLQNFYKF